MRGTVAKRIRKQIPSFPNDRPAHGYVQNIVGVVTGTSLDFYTHRTSDFRRRYRKLKRLHYVTKLPK